MINHYFKQLYWKKKTTVKIEDEKTSGSITDGNKTNILSLAKKCTGVWRSLRQHPSRTPLPPTMRLHYKRQRSTVMWYRDVPAERVLPAENYVRQTPTDVSPIQPNGRRVIKNHINHAWHILFVFFWQFVAFIVPSPPL